MPLLLLFALPFLEVYCLYWAGVTFGFVNLIFFLIVKGLIGKLIMRRASFVGTKNPQNIVASASLGVGGLLISLPTILISSIGVLILFPPTRWLFSKFFKKMFANQQNLGANFRVFNFGNFGGFPPPNGFHEANPFADNASPLTQERDVTPQIIDVRPIQNTDKKD